jgi:uncharacterized damage-inducible protein DinB
MTRFDAQELLRQLQTEVNDVLLEVEELNTASEAILNRQPAAGSWSVAQVLEHLNTYNRYYIPLIVKAIAHAAPVSGTRTFKSGWLGDYFTKSMYSGVVTSGKVTNKMNAFKGHRPDAEQNATGVLNEFIRDQKLLLQLLADAAHVDLSSARIPISISAWIKISLGDAIRFLVAHQIRHQLQMRKAFAAAAGATAVVAGMLPSLV